MTLHVCSVPVTDMASFLGAYSSSAWGKALLSLNARLPEEYQAELRSLGEFVVQELVSFSDLSALNLAC